MIDVPFQLLTKHAKAPVYASAGAAGCDLFADSFSVPPSTNGAKSDTFRLYAGQRVVVHTEVALQIPPGYEGQVRSRSGWAFEAGVFAFHGTIDSDFRGGIRVLLVNMGDRHADLKRGDRVAQVVFAPVVRPTLVQVAVVEPTERGGKGFGSSGK